MRKIKLKAIPVNPKPANEEKKKLVAVQGFLAVKGIEPTNEKMREAVKLILG